MATQGRLEHAPPLLLESRPTPHVGDVVSSTNFALTGLIEARNCRGA